MQACSAGALRCYPGSKGWAPSPHQTAPHHQHSHNNAHRLARCPLSAARTRTLLRSARSASYACSAGAPQNTTLTKAEKRKPALYSQQTAGKLYRMTRWKAPLRYDGGGDGGGGGRAGGSQRHSRGRRGRAEAGEGVRGALHVADDVEQSGDQAMPAAAAGRKQPQLHCNAIDGQQQQPTTRRSPKAPLGRPGKKGAAPRAARTAPEPRDEAYDGARRARGVPEEQEGHEYGDQHKVLFAAEPHHRQRRLNQRDERTVLGVLARRGGGGGEAGR